MRPAGLTWGVGTGEEGSGVFEGGSLVLGLDPSTGRRVLFKMGPFGEYVELEGSEGVEGSEGFPPRRAQVPKGSKKAVEAGEAEEMDLEAALKLLAFAREIGPHPDDDEMVSLGTGRFGPYVKHGKVFAGLPKVKVFL